MDRDTNRHPARQSEYGGDLEQERIEKETPPVITEGQDAGQNRGSCAEDSDKDPVGGGGTFSQDRSKKE